MNLTDTSTFSVVLITVSVVLISFFILLYIKNSKNNKAKEKEKSHIDDQLKVEPKEIEPKEVASLEVEPREDPKAKWFLKLKKGLSRSREEIFNKIENLLGGGSLKKEHLDEIEALLYAADLGPKIVEELLAILSKLLTENQNSEMAAKKEIGVKELKELLFNYLQERMVGVWNTVDDELFQFDNEKYNTRKTPKVIMVVGVNGAGKTTTIGKLAEKFSKQGARVIVGAADTFRAAAVDQLAVWCERSQTKMVRAKEGGDPSGVIYETLQIAIKEEAHYCIIDTAGRLHTNQNLMEELKKCKRVMQKLLPEAPHHTLLVIDAITGQNAIRQAEEFHSTLNLTGLIFTKCDGSAKAGSAIGIVEKLKIPITYIGVGELVEDIDRFNLSDYLRTLLNAD